MTRLSMPDGTTRFAADPTVKRRPLSERLKASAGALVGAVLLLVVGVRGVGWELALPLIAGTFVLVGVGVLIWRRTAPSRLTVTVTDTDVTYRSYGRVRSIRRDEHAGSSLVEMRQGELTFTYLVVHGTGKPFKLNHDLWRDDALAGVASVLAHQPGPPESLTVKETARRFPGLLPFWVRRQNLAAVLFLLALLVVVVAVMAAVYALDGDGSEAPSSSSEVGATRTASPDLSDAAAGRQNRLVDEVSRLVGGTEGWTYPPSALRDCADGSYQLLRFARHDAATADVDRASIDAAARRAGLEPVRPVGEEDPGTLSYADRRTSARLDVVVDGEVVEVTSASACSGVDAER